MNDLYQRKKIIVYAKLLSLHVKHDKHDMAQTKTKLLIFGSVSIG